SLLGYTGTTAAGAMAGGAASAQPARAAEAETETASADFPVGTLFTGHSSIGDIDAYLEIKFSVDTAEAPSAHRIEPAEIAKLLNDFAASRGWPSITFYGTPAPAPLN
ncbi:hypothetical protein, partial [Streptomyces sp. NPDC058964]|uniref:hypothetical protein n=1 Tax=Streptomyces sp. NPDC058964 TaxID=3346681 RepID=UPI0036A0A22A